VSRPLRRRGRWRKRWRYVAAFADEVMACAARVEVGPVGQTFWAILDRESGELSERTRMRFPGTAGEVRITPVAGGEGFDVGIDAGDATAAIRVGGGRPVEAVCTAADGGPVWTRKRAGVAVEGEVRVGERRWRLDALGVSDETDGYHPRLTVWSWSAGVGTTLDGRRVGWNLVEGINDPPTGSERAIWLDGEPVEPAPVTFEGLDAVAFADGSRLAFTPEAERSREENRLVVRYRYRQPFGSFSGALAGGIGLESGLGVMEHHVARW
jgi:hypothetical protein